jgi:hypothetical protein
VAEPEFTKPARRRAALLSRLQLYGPRLNEAETNRQAKVIALVVLTYVLVGLFINMVDPEYLTAAWLCAGAMGLAVYFTRDSRKSAINLYTVLFGVATLGCVVGYVLSRGWLVS